MSAARSRQVDVQQELFGQELVRHGGKRKGAGRKPKDGRAGAPHKARPKVDARQALHVVLRVVPAIGSMRRRKMYKAVRDATVVAAVRERIRIVHVSVQRTHLHLIVEAEGKLALARGIQGFQPRSRATSTRSSGPTRIGAGEGRCSRTGITSK
jgi:Mg-chelatase subunit ChlD